MTAHPFVADHVTQPVGEFNQQVVGKVQSQAPGPMLELVGLDEQNRLVALSGTGSAHRSFQLCHEIFTVEQQCVGITVFQFAQLFGQPAVHHLRPGHQLQALLGVVAGRRQLEFDLDGFAVLRLDGYQD